MSSLHSLRGHRGTFRALLAASFATFAGASMASTPVYVQFAGPSGETIATGVDARGITVTGYTIAGSTTNAFQYNLGSGLTFLNAGPAGKALAVSADGAVITGTMGSTTLGSPLMRGFANTSGGIQGLPISPPIGMVTFNADEALGVSWLGHEYFGATFASAVPAPTIWKATNPITPIILSSTPGSVVSGSATLTFLGGVSVSLTGVHATFWKLTNGIYVAGSFQTPSNMQSAAAAVSEDGTVTAGSIFQGTSSALTSSQAVVWNNATQAFTALPDVAGGTGLTQAFGVNWNGTVIVGAELSSNGHFVRALYWDAGHTAHDLGVEVTAEGGNLTGNHLVAAAGVSEDGDTIVGTEVTSSLATKGFLVRLNSTLHIAYMLPNIPALTGGHTILGHIHLSQPAPSGGADVLLSTSAPYFNLPASTVHFASGVQDATFPFKTFGVDFDVNGTITGSLNGEQSVLVEGVRVGNLTNVSLNKNTVTGSGTVLFTASFDGFAGPSGITIAASSSNTAAAKPASATFKVAANQQSAVEAINTFGVNATTTVTLTGTANAVSKTAQLTVNPAAMINVQVGLASLVGGANSAFYFYLNGPTGPAGQTVLTSSSSAAITIPASAKILAGTTTSDAPFFANGVSINTPVTLTAKDGAVTLTKVVTVLPAVQTGFSAFPTTVTASQTSMLTVSLNGQAPASAATITLSSSNSAALSVPAVVSVPAFATLVHIPVQSAHVSTATTVTITCHYRGGAAFTATVKVMP